ncbi:MAG: phosphoribosylformylglycinamidine synthase subunit PurQ [Euryarchaeota archaeon]|nr:phosphoribosylformylglycinamidine synthase subunit PurQ [Euryarchaeota archaeon]
MIAILRMEGTNNEDDIYNAFSALDYPVEMAHLKQFTGETKKELQKRIFDYEGIMIPGGFSAGDYVRAGAIFAARLKKIREELREFVEEGRVIGGICNGFQVLTEIGLLPGIDGTIVHKPQISLAVNDSGVFECRHIFLKHENTCYFTEKYKKGEIVQMPIAHAEGKFISSERVLKELKENNQIIFRYVNRAGKYEGYPSNPNGSLANIAGISNPEGNVFGMMPHPERVFYSYLHQEKKKNGEGRRFFESIIEYIRRRA